jgi:ABC-2 type transport system ATP-binding protein
MSLATNSPQSDSPIAAVNALTVRYGPKTVFRELSLSIPKAVSVFWGQTARASPPAQNHDGFLKPSSGDVSVMGKNVAAEPFWVRQRIGLMPEQDCHIPGMNAVTFVAYAGELAGMPSAQAMRRAH